MSELTIEARADTMTGGDAAVEVLLAEGIDTIFGLPGIQMDNLLDAMVRRGGIHFIHARNEQATTHMADAYARATGKIGCSIVVPGPGLLNAMSGLATAYGASSPVLCITGQIDSHAIGQGLGHLHEISNQLEMVRSVAKWSGRAMRPEEVAPVLQEAFRQLRIGRPRPVVVEIPPDVLASKMERVSIVPVPDEVAEPAIDELIDAATEVLRGAKKPLITVGGGVMTAGAWDELRELAEILDAPVLMTPQGKGTLSARHLLAFEWAAARDLIPAADVVVAIGTRYANPDANRRKVLPGQRLIRIDIDDFEIAQVQDTEMAIHADAKAALVRLVPAVAKVRDDGSDWADADLEAIKTSYRQRLTDIQPQAAFAAVLREELPDNTVVVAGMTQMGYWSRLGWETYEPRTFIGPGYMGTLGFELATGLGAQAAFPDRKAVVLSGDGGFMFGVQELSTAVQHQLGLICIVFNDGAFGNVRRIQKNYYGGRFIATELHNPDFMELAKAFGLHGIRAEGPEGLRIAVRGALAVQGPVLLEVPCGEMAALRRLNTAT
jgi:acetolactate synthase-1/2/3 large subunit